MTRTIAEPPKVSKVGRSVGAGAWGLLFPGGLLLLDVQILGPVLWNGTLPRTWTWPAVLLLNAGYLLAIVYTGPRIRFLWSELSSEGISYPSFSGRVVLRWAEVTEVDVHAFLVTVRGAGRRVPLSIFAFVKPETVVPYIVAAAPHAVVRPAA